MKPSVWIACVVVSSIALAQDGSRPPNVGEIAPAFGQMQWVQTEDGGGAPDIAALRGKVVIVATYGYYCDSCVRHGVPLANSLRAANAEELRVVALTCGIADDTAEVIRAEAKKLNIAYPVGYADAEGVTSPYLNLGVNSNLTFAFVVTRTGGVLWKGDPSREREAYCAAVSRALNAVPAEPLPNELAPELATALRAYVESDFGAAEVATQAALKKVGSKANDAAARVRKDGELLLGLIAETKKKLMDELERATGDEHVERFQRALERVRRAFPKGDAADRAGQLDMVMSLQRPHGPACKQWSEWFALEAARPATFPIEKDKAGLKFAKELGKYVKQPDVPGLDRARAWLRDFELAVERK